MEGCTGAWQSSIDAVKSLRCSNLKLDIVGGNAMLVTASTAQRWGWIQALSMLAEMAFCSLALSEVRYLHILALFCLFSVVFKNQATNLGQSVIVWKRCQRKAKQRPRSCFQFCE